MGNEAQRIFERLLDEEPKHTCANYLAGADPLHRQEMLTALAFDRLQYKMELVQSLRSASDDDWNQALYRLYFRTLGDNENQRAYLTLAERVPYRIVLRERTKRQAVEAMLLGVSGLLTLYEHDLYVADLLREFSVLAAKYRLEPMEASEWVLHVSRPANHPLLRIAQASRFFEQHELVLKQTMECRTMEEIHRFLGVEAPDYWNRHYTPGVEHEAHPKRIGKSKAEIFGINFVAVLQFAYGSYTRNEQLLQQALQLLERIAPENNRVIRKWCDAGVPAPASAFESQALLQLAKNYCKLNRCPQCPVGRRIADKVRLLEEQKG